MRMKFICIGQTLRCVSQSNIASGTVNYIGADFDFKSDDWSGLTKWANFVGDDGEVHRFCLVDDSISESATMGLNLTAGSWSCYVYGNEIVSGEVVTRITTTSAHFNVNEVSEESSVTTLPTEAETIIAEMQGYKSDTYTYKTQAGNYATAAATSETSAATSASTATTKASEAAASATEAAASAASVTSKIADIEKKTATFYRDSQGYLCEY